MIRPTADIIWPNHHVTDEKLESDTSLPRLLERAEIPLGKLSAIAGLDESGSIVELDIAGAPHLLIAGTTGSGKSNLLHALISSLLFRYSPAQLRLLFIDAGGVELSAYDNVPQALSAAVTVGQTAVEILLWVQREIERRTNLFVKYRCRSLLDFNRLIGEESQPIGEDAGSSETRKALPRLVIIIDGLGDMQILVDKKLSIIESMATHGQAAGVHLICTTQAPNSLDFTVPVPNVFPARLVLRLAARSDSHALLLPKDNDVVIASGKGFLIGPGHRSGVKIENACISQAETSALASWWSAEVEREGRLPPARLGSDDFSAAKSDVDADFTDADLGKDADELDPLFEQAAEIVIAHGEGSTSLLQRRLKIGYGRAAKLIDQLCTNGVIGKASGSMPRKVLVRSARLAGPSMPSTGPAHHATRQRLKRVPKPSSSGGLFSFVLRIFRPGNSESKQ